MLYKKGFYMRGGETPPPTAVGVAVPATRSIKSGDPQNKKPWGESRFFS
jgi:hypothetical protein